MNQGFVAALVRTPMLRQGCDDSNCSAPQDSHIRALQLVRIVVPSRPFDVSNAHSVSEVAKGLPCACVVGALRRCRLPQDCAENVSAARSGTRQTEAAKKQHNARCLSRTCPLRSITRPRHSFQAARSPIVRTPRHGVHEALNPTGRSSRSSCQPRAPEEAFIALEDVYMTHFLDLPLGLIRAVAPTGARSEAERVTRPPP
jgi:hypothetical protein